MSSCSNTAKLKSMSDTVLFCTFFNLNCTVDVLSIDSHCASHVFNWVRPLSLVFTLSAISRFSRSDLIMSTSVISNHHTSRVNDIRG